MNKKINLKINNHNLKGVIENYKAKKLLILAHGFTGDWRGPANIFVKLSNKLQQQNLAIMRFNFIGTPPSEGKFEDMTVAGEAKELKKVIAYAKSLGYQKIGVLGESMAGTIIVKAYQPDLKCVVFWYPTFNFSDDSFADYLVKKAQVKLKSNGYLLVNGFRVGKKFISQIKSIDVRRQIKKINCPVLFIHGDGDRDVPCRQSRQAFKIVEGPKELHILRGADHCFRNEQTKVIELTANFLKHYF